MESLLNQSFSVSDIVPYLGNSYAFWIIFYSALFLINKALKNPIGNLSPCHSGPSYPKPTYNDNALGTGFAWCYVANLAITYYDIKWIAYWCGDNFYNHPLPTIVLAVAALLFSISFVTVWLNLILLVAFTFIGFGQSGIFGDLFRSIL